MTLPVTAKARPDWAHSTRRLIGYAVSTYGLIIFTLLLIVAFGISEPQTFLTGYTLSSVLSTQAITVMFALAETVVVAAQQFDLSVGYLSGFASILIVLLQVQDHVGWVLAVLIGLAVGVGAGLLNGLVITVLRIDSFIATLGSGTVIYGLSELVTGGIQVSGNLPNGFNDIGGNVWYIPVPAIIALGVATVFWVVLEYTVFGRRLYVVGASLRGAELVGLKPPSLIRWAFVVAGLLVGIGAVLVAAEFRVAEPDIGPSYLLPAFAGAFLGATSVRPGRVNVWGTVVASLLLGVADTGLLELGAAFYVQSLFSGGLLIVAVGVAVLTGQKRSKRVAPKPAGGDESTEPGGPSTTPEEAAEELSALGAAVRSRVPGLASTDGLK